MQWKIAHIDTYEWVFLVLLNITFLIIFLCENHQHQRFRGGGYSQTMVKTMVPKHDL